MNEFLWLLLSFLPLIGGTITREGTAPIQDDDSLDADEVEAEFNKIFTLLGGKNIDATNIENDSLVTALYADDSVTLAKINEGVFESIAKYTSDTAFSATLGGNPNDLPINAAATTINHSPVKSGNKLLIMAYVPWDTVSSSRVDGIRVEVDGVDQDLSAKVETNDSGEGESTCWALVDTTAVSMAIQVEMMVTTGSITNQSGHPTFILIAEIKQ